MNTKTFDQLTQLLVEEIEEHPYRHEIVELAIEQLIDDTELNGNRVGTMAF